MGWIEQRRTQRCGVSYCYPDVEAGLSELKRDGWFGVFGIPKQQDAGFKRDRRGLNQLFPVGTSPWRCSISPLYCQYVLHYFYIFCCIYICSSIYLSIRLCMSYVILFCLSSADIIFRGLVWPITFIPIYNPFVITLMLWQVQLCVLLIIGLVLLYEVIAVM